MKELYVRLDTKKDREKIKEIIKIAFFLENTVILERVKESLLLVVTNSNLYNFERAIQSGMYINHNKNIPNKDFFCDWFREIKNYDKIENLINSDTLKHFGNIKVVDDKESLEYRCHINSKEYFGNGHDKKSLEEAIRRAFLDAIKHKSSKKLII